MEAVDLLPDGSMTVQFSERMVFVNGSIQLESLKQISSIIKEIFNVTYFSKMKEGSPNRPVLVDWTISGLN